MSGPVQLPVATPPKKQSVRSLVITVLLISLAVHVVAAIIAGAVIVARYFAQPPAEFKVVKDIRLPAQEREHKMNMAEFDSLTPKPSFNDKLSSLRPTAFALPELPNVPMDQMLPLDPSEVISDQVSSLVGAGGAGGGGGGGGGGGMGGTGIGTSFFGIKTEAKKIVLLFDVSTSVITKMGDISKVKEETTRLISSLSINTRFGMIQFTQNFKPFQSELVAATDPNKELASKWVENEWTTAGTMSGKGVVSNQKGIIAVLERAFLMQPDAIFLLSDGDFQWRPGGTNQDVPYDQVRDFLKAQKASMGREVPIHFIAFQIKPDDKAEWAKMSRGSGGQFKEMKP